MKTNHQYYKISNYIHQLYYHLPKHLQIKYTPFYRSNIHFKTYIFRNFLPNIQNTPNFYYSYADFTLNIIPKICIFHYNYIYYYHHHYYTIYNNPPLNSPFNNFYTLLSHSYNIYLQSNNKYYLHTIISYNLCKNF